MQLYFIIQGGVLWLYGTLVYIDCGSNLAYGPKLQCLTTACRILSSKILNYQKFIIYSTFLLFSQIMYYTELQCLLVTLDISDQTKLQDCHKINLWTCIGGNAILCLPTGICIMIHKLFKFGYGDQGEGYFFDL